jgi:hypothetical protein
MRSSMRMSLPPQPNLKIKRPNGETFYMDTMGDMLMRSQSEGLNPFHMSNYKMPKMDDNSRYNFPSKSKLQMLGENIHKQKDYNVAHNIGKFWSNYWI